MNSLESTFAQWEQDFSPGKDKDSGKTRRRALFQALEDVANDLFNDRGAALYVQTFHDGSNRDMLAIVHRARRARPAAVRLLINDYATLSSNPARPAIHAKRYIAIPGRRLISTDSYEIPEADDGMYEPVLGGFWMQKQDAVPIVKVRHASGYGPEFPQDVPSITAEGLERRAQAAQDMLRILSGYGAEDISRVDYIFEASHAEDLQLDL